MGDISLYDEDILIWSEQQAAALRSLAARHDLPNELDLANVIEEIEDVLVHLILLWADPDAPAVRGWIAEIAAWDSALRRRASPSMRSRLDLTSLRREAQRLAALKLAVWDEAKSAAVVRLVGTGCPLPAQEIPMGGLDIRAVVARIVPS